MKISIILTSYNHENFIRQSIDSVLAQSYQEFELIIIDDFSTDKSWDIICEYKKKHPTIVTVRHSYNWGNGVVTDAVRNYATGDYIAIHHSDDVWEPDKLELQVKALQEHPKCAAVFTNAAAIDENGNPYEQQSGFYYKLFSVANRSRHEWLNHFFYSGNCLCHPSILIRKSAYMEDDFFRKGLRQIPDFVKWIQVCKKHEIYVLPQQLVKFRVHSAGKNTSGMRASTQIRSTIELFLMLEEYRTISGRDEFLKIFPEAAVFCQGDYYSTDYVLGRLCTQETMPTYTRMYGNQLLYCVLNQKEAAEHIKEEYQYTAKTFIDDNGKYDIFGILPKGFEQVRTLYFDFGTGFCIENSITEKYTLGNDEAFHMCVTITLNPGQQLQQLRFDPCEGILAKVRLREVLVNGKETAFAPENALDIETEMDHFVTVDPIYHIVVPKESMAADEIIVEITGKICRFSEEEIGNTVTNFLYNSRGENTLNHEIQNSLKHQTEEMSKEIALLHEEITELSTQKDCLQKEFDKTADAYRQLQTANLHMEQQFERIRGSILYKLYTKLTGKTL